MNTISTENIIKDLTKQYDEWASIIDASNRNSQGFWLGTIGASFYVRNMARGIISGNLVLCLATISIEEDYQNKGVLTSFLEYVTNNMHSFKEIEIENIQTKKLFESMIKKGFSPKKESHNEEYFMPITVFKKIKD